MSYWALKAFRGKSLDEQMGNSEVYREFKKAYAYGLIEEKKLSKAAEQSALAEIESFKDLVRNSPEMRNKLAEARDHLQQHPELSAGVDPNFLRGIELFNMIEGEIE